MSERMLTGAQMLDVAPLHPFSFVVRFASGYLLSFPFLAIAVHHYETS